MLLKFYPQLNPVRYQQDLSQKTEVCPCLYSYRLDNQLKVAVLCEGDLQNLSV